MLLSYYKYDSNNKMISAERYNGDGSTLTTSYTYNVFGDRTSKTVDGVTTYYTPV